MFKTTITTEVQLFPLAVQSNAVQENLNSGNTLVPFSAIPAHVLAAMADDYRFRLFKAAGKQDPNNYNNTHKRYS